MKKSILILAAATSVIFAACNGGGAEGEYSQAQLDSIKQAGIDSAATAFKNQNDSIINAEATAAARTADSLRVIDSVFNAGNKKTTTTTTVRKTTKPSSGSNTGGKQEVKEETTTKTVDKTDPSYRPGAKNSTSNTGDGTQEKQAPKATSDRPGAKNK